MTEPPRGIGEFGKIVLLSTGAAILYGILHDQVTARICVEYFTIGHPPVFPTTSPTLLALGWGVIATWWVGVPLGYLFAMTARLGRRPRLDARDLVRPLALVLVGMAICAIVFGAIGGILAARGDVWLVQPLADTVPRDRHTRFLIDLWAHNASYDAGILGGIVLSLWIWRRRLRFDLARSTFG